MRHQDTQVLASCRIYFLSIFTALLLSIGCASGSKDDDEFDGGTGTDGEQTEENFSLGARTNEAGRAAVSFQLAAGVSKFAVSAFVGSDQELRFIQLVNSNQTNYLDPNGQEISFSDSFAPEVNTAIAPSRSLDPDLTQNDRITTAVEVGQNRSNQIASDSEVTFVVNSKRDSDLDSGTLRVNVFYVGEVGQDDFTKQISAVALEEFRRIYGASAAIGVDFREFDIDGQDVLPVPYDGSSFYQANSALTEGLGVNLFIGADIAGNDAGNILGLSAGIPGPPLPSTRSGVAIGIIPAAGPDGRFTNDEVRILAETMAHETGHFLGLFHPADFQGNSVEATDPLTDTDSCRSFTECLSNPDLTANLMFVSPVADGGGGFVRQDQLSGQQRSVLNRYIAVN